MIGREKKEGLKVRKVGVTEKTGIPSNVEGQHQLSRVSSA